MGEALGILLYILMVGFLLLWWYSALCWSGVMPMECWPPSLARSVRWLSTSSSASSPWWRQKGGGGSDASSPNKRVAASVRAALVFSRLASSRHGGGKGRGGMARRGSSLWWVFSLDLSFQRDCPALICWRASSVPPAAASIAVMERWRWSQGKLDVADGVRELTRRWIWRNCGALAGRCPVDSDKPPYPQVEGRPFAFLPAMEPKGRQDCFTVESMAWSHGGLAGPSGAVPGAGEAGSSGEQNRTRSQSSSFVRGLFCNLQGLVCNCPCLWGPVAKCTPCLSNE
ncbi:hypothetical protein CFC21_018018 [Triticum aestivum]|uniref:Uncharacterized protein n=2 Tax=Triticum aestivum TaxID=4565 RepID=A0A3B6B2E0_WHEAT|nr:hypothetical protein CFC21_018018 [Triticum aestivum]